MKFKILYLTFSLLLLAILSCKNTNSQQKISEDEKKIYIKKGQEVINQTFAVLAGKLQGAMKEGGVPNAINYCNLNAMPIVDSLSKAYDCTIRRTTLKARNPANIAKGEEAQILKEYEAAALEGKALTPIVQHDQTKTISFFAPIKVNAFCLQCHGKVGETLKETDYALIKKHYPNDAATGYTAGDLRGMWRVTFQN